MEAARHAGHHLMATISLCRNLEPPQLLGRYADSGSKALPLHVSFQACDQLLADGILRLGSLYSEATQDESTASHEQFDNQTQRK